jgi:hypothetical protein
MQVQYIVSGAGRHCNAYWKMDVLRLVWYDRWKQRFCRDRKPLADVDAFSMLSYVVPLSSRQCMPMFGYVYDASTSSDQVHDRDQASAVGSAWAANRQACRSR